MIIYEISMGLIMLAFAITAVGGSIYFIISLFRPSGPVRYGSSYLNNLNNQDYELKKMNEILTRNRNDSRADPNYYKGSRKQG